MDFIPVINQLFSSLIIVPAIHVNQDDQATNCNYLYILMSVIMLCLFLITFGGCILGYSSHMVVVHFNSNRAVSYIGSGSSKMSGI